MALVMFTVALGVIDLVFVAVVVHAGSDRSGGPLVAWAVVQAVAVFAAGVVHGVRRRAWWELSLVAAAAALALSFAVLAGVDPSPGSAQCPGSEPCDTAFGLGAVLIGGFAFVVLGVVVTVGQAIGRGVLRVISR